VTDRRVADARLKKLRPGALHGLARAAIEQRRLLESRRDRRTSKAPARRLPAAR
jgi:hypothetical protein